MLEEIRSHPDLHDAEPRGRPDVNPEPFGMQLLDLERAVPRVWPTIPDLLLVIVACAAQVLLADSYYGPVAKICAGVDAAIIVLLVTRYVRVRPPRLPWIEVMFAAHYANFGLAVLVEPHTAGLRDMMPHVESFEFCSPVALLAGICMIVGFAAGRSGGKRVSAGSFLPRLDPHTLEAGSHFFVPMSCLYVLLNGLVPSSRAILLPATGLIQSIFYLTPLIVVPTVVYLVRPQLVNFLQVVAAFITIGVVTLASSMLGNLIFPSAAFFVLWWRARERLPIGMLLVVVSGILILQPAKVYYRTIQVGHRGETANSDVQGVVDAWEQAFELMAADSKSSTIQTQSGTEATLDRMSELTTLAYVVEKVPAAIPYADGMVYPLALKALVPRIVWPEKPWVQEFGLNPIILALDLSTPVSLAGSAFGISLTSQGYFEHGILGSLVWLAGYGALAGVLSRYLGTKLAGLIGGAVIFGPWGAASTADFVSVFGGIWQMTFGATALTWILWLAGGGYRTRATFSKGRQTAHTLFRTSTTASHAGRVDTH